MFGLSIKNLRNSFGFNHIGGFSRELATVKKVYRWRIKRFFSPCPSFKEQVEANEYGITSDIRWHEVFADGFAESEITRVLQRRIKKDRDYKREVRWMKALELHIGHLMKTRKKPDVYLFEDRAIFVERGRYAASFFKTRNRLGFFAKRFSSCSDPKNIIGFIRAPLYYMHAYTGFSSTREKIVIGLVRGMTGGNMCWQVSGEGKEVIKIIESPLDSYETDALKVIHNHVFKAYKYYRDADRKFLVDIPRSIREFEAEYAYRNALTPDDVMTLMKPFLRFVEAYKSMYTDLMADLKKIHKKNRFGRLFLSKELFNRREEEAKVENNNSPEKEEVDDTVLYSSWSMYCDGNRIPTKLRLLDKDRVYVFLDKSNKRAVPIKDEEKLDWLLWRKKAKVLRLSGEEVKVQLLW